MNGVVVHSEVDEANPNSIPVTDDKRCGCRSGLAVEGEPVELHVHGVRHLDVRQDGVLLHNDCEVFIDARLVWLLGMHDERADHAHHFLHRHVRVVEISAFLVEREFIDKSATGRDRVLTRTGRSVHLVRDFEAVPVHRCRFGKVVIHHDSNAIALVHLNRRTRSAAVVTPEVNRPARKYLLFNRLSNEMEFLYVSVHAPRKLRNVGSFHGNDPSAAALGSVAHVLHVHGRSALLRGCKQARCSGQTCAQAKSISKEITSVLHGSSSSRIGGPKCPQQTQWTLDRTEMHGQAIDITSLLWLPVLEGEGNLRCEGC